MTNELARIFGLADPEKLDAIIETYVSVFGEKYRKRIEYVVKNTTFMVNAATKGVNSVEDFLRDKRYYDRYVQAAQEEFYEFSGIKYAEEKMKSIEVEKVSSKLKLFRRIVQGKRAEKSYNAQREAFIREYREARGITDEKIAQKEKELKERVESFAREDQEIAEKIRGMELFSQGQQYIEQKRSEISPELRSKEIEYAEEIMAQVKNLYPDMKTCSAEDLVDAFREEYNNVSARSNIAKSKLWEMLQIPKSFIERNYAALCKIWHYAGDTLGKCFLDEKEVQRKHDASTDPWIADSLQALSRLNICENGRRERLQSSVMTESTEETGASGLTCVYLDEATGRPMGLVLMDIGEVNDNIVLHEVIHCLGHHKTEYGEIYSGFNGFEKFFNEILTEWLTQKCLKKLREQGKCILNHHDFVCGYRPGFFMFDELFETYFEELVEAVMTGREKIFKSFTEQEFEELKNYAEICLRYCGNGNLNGLVGQMRKLGVELELDKNHNLTKEGAAKIVEHADEILANTTDPSMIEFVKAVVSAHELCTELIEYKASNRQLDYPPEKAAEQRKKIDRIL